MPETIARPQCFNVSDMRVDPGQVLGIREAVASEGVAHVRGLVDPGECKAVLSRLAGFSHADDQLLDHKSRAARPEDIPNYQRLMLGEWGAPETQRSFFMRLFYNPLWNEDQYGMHGIFRRLIALRNSVLGARDDYCLEAPEDGIYSLSRIHQYPSGGGFLGSHRDSKAAAVSVSGSNLDYYQVLLVMSRKGEDFEQGGGYYVRDGERVMYEEFAEQGDVLIYNGQIMHGVQAVDPHLPADLDSARGRFSATVTLYRVRNGKMNLG